MTAKKKSTISYLEQKIEEARERFDKLNQEAEKSSKPLQEIQAETIAELSTALEELYVTAEELYQQQEELLATREEVEFERQRYQNLFEFAPDGYLVTDARGIIQSANYAAEELLNINRESLVGKPFIIFVDKVDRVFVETQLGRIIGLLDRKPKGDRTEDKAYFGEWGISLQPRTKAPFPAWVTLSVGFDRQGKPLRLRWLIRDLTEYKEAREKIQQQAALLDITQDAIIVRDLEQKILFWNKGAERLYGWRKEEALGKKVSDLLYKESLSELENPQKTRFSEGFWQGELNQISKSGKNILVASRWSLMRDPRNNPKSILEVNTDITEQKQLEKQLNHIQRLESIGTLASGIAHDLNNILAPMLGIAQLLPLKLTNIDKETRQLLEFLEQNSRRGADLVKQVLFFSQQVEPQHYVLRLESSIAEVKQFIEQTLPKSIEIETQISRDLWQIRADPAQLHQVLVNLCVNARDAMGDRFGTLSISAKNFTVDEAYTQMNPEAKIGNYVVITVADTGSGIAPEYIDRIFEPFFTTKKPGEGTGLGLSTIRGIVKNHGGFITLSSDFGKGTQFNIYLPATDMEQELTAKLEQINLPLGNGELILVVDDEAAIREISKTTLETYNYKVLSASDGLEAIAVYSEHRDEIKAIVMDMMMPKMDGITAIEVIQKINPQVKAIVVSGLALSDRLAITKQVGIDNFLPKPYTAEQLLVALKEVLAG